MPSKSLFVGKETQRPFRHLRAKTVIFGGSKWDENFFAQLSHIDLARSLP